MKIMFFTAFYAWINSIFAANTFVNNAESLVVAYRFFL